MKKFLNIIRKFFKLEKVVDPIVDEVDYSSNLKSFSGNSLSESNVLVVHNGCVEEALYASLFSNENACCAFATVSGGVSIDELVSAGNKLLGPFTHIINIIELNELNSFIDALARFNQRDAFSSLFRLLQTETEYLVKINQYATITTALKLNSSIDSAVAAQCLELLIEGLSPLLANHNLICNGIVVGAEVPSEDVYRTTLFLCGKYGQILTGEVLRMD